MTLAARSPAKVALLTGKGQPVPFNPAPPQSQLTVCITA